MNEIELAKNLLLERNCRNCIHSDKSYADIIDDKPLIMTLYNNIRCNSHDYITKYPDGAIFEIYPVMFYQRDESRTELTTLCPDSQTCDFWEGK